jgi:hypothetical protein
MASKTFGITLSIWDVSLSTDAYTEIKGLLDITPPSKVADEPADATSHSSTSGIREFEPIGTFTYSDVSAEMNDLPTDPGQMLLPAMIGTQQKFKVVKVSDPSNPIFFNADVIGFEEGANPVNGKATRTLTLKPTGVPPIS